MTDQGISGRWGIPRGFEHTNVPNFILDNYASLGVSNIQLALIIHLASFRYDSDKTQGSRPSINTLAELMGLSYKSVLTHLQKLHEDGWVIIHSGKEDGKPSEYDFSPLTLKCLEIAKQGGLKKDSHRRSEKRFRGVRYQGLKKNSHKEKALKQEEKKEQESPTPSSVFLGDSALPSETTSGTDKGPKTKPNQDTPPSSAPPPPTDPLVPTLAKVLRDELPLPPEWTDTHTYLYVTWLGKSPKKKLIVSAFDNADRIYRLLVKALPDTPLTPAIAHEFYVWYYSQEWVLKKQAENKMADTPQEAVPLPGVDKLPKHLGDWLASRQAQPVSASYIPPQEDYRRKQARGGMFGVGVGK